MVTEFPETSANNFDENYNYVAARRREFSFGIDNEKEPVIKISTPNDPTHLRLLAHRVCLRKSFYENTIHYSDVDVPCSSCK